MHTEAHTEVRGEARQAAMWMSGGEERDGAKKSSCEVPEGA